MKQQICKYFAEHPKTSLHQCAAALKQKENVLFREIEELCRDGYLTIAAIVPLDESPELGNSDFYSLRKPYPK